MSINYRIILMDEFDWGYVGNSRETTVEKIYKHTNYAVESSVPHLLILDTGRDYPEKAMIILNAIGIVWDASYYQRDNEMELVSCRLTDVEGDTTASQPVSPESGAP